MLASCRVSDYRRFEGNTYRFPFNKLSVRKLETLPLVLSFSNSVTGLDNQTISLSIDGSNALELDWRPVEPWRNYGRKWTTNIMHHLPQIVNICSQYRGGCSSRHRVSGWTRIGELMAVKFSCTCWRKLSFGRCELGRRGELTEDSSNLRRQYEQSGLLQFKRRSLCSVEFTERFLWVQNLDLSHKQLRSTHGLEALQVLVNLNLSHNRIGSVTALAPLRDVSALLKDIDVSFNQIGDHSVDACRFLCSSKLTNSAPATPGFLKVGECWEIKTVFGGLCWRDLNIAGNSAAEDAEFVDALTRALDGTAKL